MEMYYTLGYLTDTAPVQQLGEKPVVDIVSKRARVVFPTTVNCSLH